jgi:hypothetical protein
MWDRKITARKGPSHRVVVVIENDLGGIDGHLIRPEQAMQLARDLMEAATTVAAPGKTL